MHLAPRFLLAALITLGSAHAQSPDASVTPEASDTPKNARQANDVPYRYPVASIAQTVRELQHSTLAMQLREYCADEKIPDGFVNERLAEFGRITGREEDCRTLLEYY